MTLPRLAFKQEAAAQPATAFAAPVTETWLEIGFGGGEHAVSQARAHPHAGLIACEVFENGICSLLSHLVPEGDEATSPVPGNLRLFTHDARILLRALPESALEKIFLLFPDPWPKARHAKRRFVHPEQIWLMARVLRPGGEWRVASDDPTYQAWVAEVMGAQAFFTYQPAALTRPEHWPPTRYEAKALRASRAARYWSFIRRA